VRNRRLSAGAGTSSEGSRFFVFGVRAGGPLGFLGFRLRVISYTSGCTNVKIYTRTGDAGDTSLFGGTRVRKDDARVDAYGEVDELNAWLGLVRALGPPAKTKGARKAKGARKGSPGTPALDDALAHIQRDLFALGAELADPAGKIARRVTKATLGAADVARLEQLIDRLEAGLPPLRKFILAGGTPQGAALHLARTVCRRAERRMVSLTPPVDEVLLRYVNRLSDLLFVMARAANHRARAPEIEW
jgi:cob(I)alamin adenosyltransferase